MMGTNKNSSDIKMLSHSTRQITFVGLMSAVMCVLGPLSIPMPISLVPVSLTNFAVYVTAYVLGMKYSTVSYLVYLLLGLAGVPVFSSFRAGIGTLLGPTGGYLIGFTFIAIIGGFFVDKYPSKRLLHLLGMALGTIVCYLLGTLWLSFQAGITFFNALLEGVVPFLIVDVVKILISVSIGPQLQKSIQKARR